MDKKIDFSVGDRVVAKTDDWGRFTGVVVEVAFGRYLKIRSDSDNKIYGVPAAVCCQESDGAERRTSQT